jgi:hypothetical protein
MMKSAVAMILVCTSLQNVDVASPPNLPEAGLLIWLDAADSSTLELQNGAVARWTSKAGNADVVFSSPESQRPTLRKSGKQRPAIVFDGIDDVLRCVQLDCQTTTWSLVAVVAPLPPIRGGGICSATPPNGHDYDPGLTVDLFGARGLFDQISVEGAGRIGGQADQLSSEFRPGGMHVVIVLRDEGQIRLFVDGKMEGDRPVSPAVTTFREFRVGARFFAGEEREYFCGEVATVLFYGRTLGDEERQTIESSLCVREAERNAGEQRAEQIEELRRRNRMVAPRVLRSWPNVDRFLQEQKPGLDLDAAPVRTNIRTAIGLSMTHLNSLFDADRDNEPYFYVNCQSDGTGKMYHSVNIGIPHVVGRCLLGTMMGEMATGIPSPQRGLEIHEQYLRRSFANSDHLNSYVDPAQNDKRCIEFHNMREGLYGLWALAAGRDSRWARDTAHQMLETLDRLTTEKGEWSKELADQIGMGDRSYGLAVANSARMVDALLAYHAVTEDPLAMKLAGLYARSGLETLFTPDGHFAAIEKSSGHVHSITSSLSGMTAYAIVADDATMLKRCRRIMDVGVPEYFSSWGWGDEVFPDHPADVVSRGEINQTGDVVRTALLLGSVGLPEYYELAERYLRSMLLPTQHRLAELRLFLDNAQVPEDDSEYRAVERSVGGYAMQLPNDRMRTGDWPVSTLDITSGAVHAMSECYLHRVRCDEDIFTVNLLFDYRDRHITIDSHLPFCGRIDFVARTDVNKLRCRIPGWVDRSTLQVHCAERVRVSGVDASSHVELSGLQAGDRGAITFDVPVKVERENVDGVTYTTTWIGNQIIEIQPRGSVSPLPF